MAQPSGQRHLGGVGVVEADEQAAAVLAGVELVQQRRLGVTDVQVTCAATRDSAP